MAENEEKYEYVSHKSTFLYIILLFLVHNIWRNILRKCIIILSLIHLVLINMTS
jgi:hypothetical protein